MSISISTQIPNQKAAKRKTKQKHEISREQYSKQANIRQEKLWNVTQKVRLVSPVFITSGIYALLSSGSMHGGRRLCTFFHVLRGLSHRKAALTLLLRADSQQLSVKVWWFHYAWLSSGITYGGRRLGFLWVFFACFRWIISSKSSVNISVASWLTTVASELWFIRGVFKRKFFPAFLTTTRIASADVYKWDSLAIVDRCMALEFWTAYTLWICPLWLRIIKSVYGGRIFEPRWWGCICNSVDGDSIFEPRWQDYIYNFAFESVNGGSI